VQADGFAKVNLSLQVRPPDSSGLHPLRSLVHSVDWPDTVELLDADEDRFTVAGDPSVPADGSNLAVRALEAVRSRGNRRPVALHLEKRIPAEAGLGGGSADAAAVLTLAGRRFGVPRPALESAAPRLGADVPFCLVGGAAWMEGHGEKIGTLPALSGFALAVVVPPLRLATAGVYRRWDRLGGPAGHPVSGRTVPVPLRDHVPLVNDLLPAALDVEPGLGDWIADLERRWGVPVLMSGSGPSLFGFFPTADEASGAVEAAGAVRAGRACLPAARGVVEPAGGTLG
jgi:4-diphosphocytidyl-2-C-methyl-D-erythritol kinase